MTADTTGRFTGAARRATVARAIRFALLPVLLLTAWQLVPLTGAVSPTKLPPLHAVLTQMVELLLHGELLADIAFSLTRIGVGFALTVVIGTALGFLLSRVRLLARLLDPLLQALRLTPVIAAAPLFILWFGFGEESKIAIVAAMGVFAMYLAAYTAFRSVSPELREVARLLGFGFWQSIIRLHVPAALPRLITGARFALLLSWMSLTVAELIGADRGIGRLAMSGAALNPENIFVGVILFAVFAKLSDAVFVRVTRPLVSWQRTTTLHPGE